MLQTFLGFDPSKAVLACLVTAGLLWMLQPVAYRGQHHLKELLDHDPALREAFEKAKREDSAVASDPVAQLQWLYQHTPASELEKWTRLYPVGRLRNAGKMLNSGN